MTERKWLLPSHKQNAFHSRLTQRITFNVGKRIFKARMSTYEPQKFSGPFSSHPLSSFNRHQLHLPRCVRSVRVALSYLITIILALYTRRNRRPPLISRRTIMTVSPICGLVMDWTGPAGPYSNGPPRRREEDAFSRSHVRASLRV